MVKMASKKTKVISVRLPYDVIKQMKDDELNGKDAIELMMAGASAVQVGAAIFTDPYAPVRIVEEMNDFLDKKGISSVRDIIGTVQLW